MRLLIIFFALFLGIACLTHASNSMAKDEKSGSGQSSLAAKNGSGSRLHRDLNGLSAYVSFNSSDEMSTNGSYGGSSFAGTIRSETAFGMGLQYLLHRFSNRVGMVLGGNYEFGQDLINFRGSASGVPVRAAYDPKPTLSILSVDLQADYPLLPRFSIFGGGNYSIPQLRNFPGSSRGRLGFQFGGSFALTQNFAIDGLYRQLNFAASADNGVEYDYITLAGLMVRGRYVF